MTYKPKTKTIITAIVIYFILLLLGLFLIMLLQRSFQRYMLQEAKDYIHQYQQNDYQPFAIDNENMTVLLYSHGDFQTLYADNNPLQVDHLLKSITYSHEQEDTFYIIRFDLEQFKFLSLYGQRMTKQDGQDGLLLYGHYLSYLNSVLLAYFLIYSICYFLVCLSFYIISKNNHKLTTIHHQYLANVSHELKSPISSIQAIADTLSEMNHLSQETLSKYYGIILRESTRLDKTVKNIIELSKLQDPYNHIDKSYYYAYELLDPIYQRYEEWCENLDINFHLTDQAKNLPALFTNKESMQKLLTILLDNAMKFMDPQDQLTIDATVHTSHITMTIADTGCGIAPEHLPYIFQRFYKVDDSRNNVGTGLGLSMAKEILNRLGEEIQVKSTLGEGTQFTFTISRAPYKKRKKNPFRK